MSKLPCSLALAFAFALPGAWAEPIDPTAATAVPTVRNYVDVASSGNGYDCSPAPVGSGTAPTIRSNKAGTVAWWYCATASGSWRVNWAAATAEQMSIRNVFAEFRAVLLAPDPRAAFRAAVAKNVKMPVDAPAIAAVWQPFAAEMNARKPTALPIAVGDPPAPGGTLSSMLAWAAP